MTLRSTKEYVVTNTEHRHSTNALTQVAFTVGCFPPCRYSGNYNAGKMAHRIRLLRPKPTFDKILLNAMRGNQWV